MRVMVEITVEVTDQTALIVYLDEHIDRWSWAMSTAVLVQMAVRSACRDAVVFDADWFGRVSHHDLGWLVPLRLSDPVPGRNGELLDLCMAAVAGIDGVACVGGAVYTMTDDAA